MKKKKAAKMLSPARARECDFARSVARLIAKANDYWRRAANAAPDSKEEHMACETATNLSHMVGLRITNIDNLAKLLRLIANALEGKRLGAMYDDAILKAYEKAMRTGKRYAERSMSLMPFISEVYDALPAKRKDTKRKDTKPLTPKEKQTIRELEWSDCSHTVIEKTIGKRYKRIDFGDYVAVNENGDAPLAKRTLKRKKPTKDGLRVRIKALGRHLTEKPGAPRKRP